MNSILLTIRSRLSIYVVFLLLISSYLLIFPDRREMKSKNLEREARFAFFAGIVYAVIAAIMVILGVSLPL